MPNIKPFCALMPAMQMQAKVACHATVGYQSNAQVDLWESCGIPITENISKNLHRYLENHTLQFDTSSCLYVYQVVHDGRSQVGIWTLTHINDYASGEIKRHGLTIPIRENMLAEYFIKTGVDANPVLLTYLPNDVVDAIISKYLLKDPAIDLELSDKSRHIIWRISAADDLMIISEIFYKMRCVYIADGHHRAAAMAKMADKKRQQCSTKYTGREPYNYFSSIYMNTTEITVLEYNRLIRDLGVLNSEQMLTQLSAFFKITVISESFKPSVQHEIAMYLDGVWYKLSLFSELINSKDPVEQLGVCILQNHILMPILNISDPRADPRLSFESAKTDVRQVEALVTSGEFRVAFVLRPISILQLMKVADANQFMPPKSTWIEPKFPVGLLTNYFG